MSKSQFHVVSLSGGKDSTAMLLRMIEEQMPIDLILFCDTGLEFLELYHHLDKLEKHIGMPITHIKAETTFEYYLLEHRPKFHKAKKTNSLYGDERIGFSWPGPRQRWCTNRLKDSPREKFMRSLREKYDVLEYIGIAADETNRLDRKRNQSPNHVHPLVDWNMTEADCLKYCYDRGFDWGGLYELFQRVSCWCCPLQGLDELRMLRKHFPDLWQQLMDWDGQTWRSFRADYSVKELDIRFAFEKECLEKGLPIKGKAFFHALKQQLEKKTP